MRFLFCLDLSLHAGAGKKIWNLDFVKQTRPDTCIQKTGCGACLVWLQHDKQASREELQDGGSIGGTQLLHALLTLNAERPWPLAACETKTGGPAGRPGLSLKVWI